MTETGVSPSAPAQPPARSTLVTLLAWIRDLMLSVMIAIVVILFLYRPVKVEGTSMMPGLTDQERIFINQFTYRLGMERIQTSDLVVFWFQGDYNRSYIKRVIGVPGDVVEIESGQVVVNGKRLEERYVPDEFRDQQSMPPTLVPPDEYFVLGDHRSSSNDSRAWGMVPRRYIYGKAVAAYWPLNKFGLLY